MGKDGYKELEMLKRKIYAKLLEWKEKCL